MTQAVFKQNLINQIAKNINDSDNIGSLERTIENAFKQGIFHARYNRYDRAVFQFKIAYVAMARVEELTGRTHSKHGKGQITEQGIKIFELVYSYGLAEFYQAEMGNLVIEPSKLTMDVMSKVLNFLSNNTDWAMAYEDIGDGEQIIYVAMIDELNV